MWLLNHSAARKFEIAMLKRIGVSQIFLPKIFPADPGFRSSSVDWSEDRNLDLSPEDLNVMNSTDWYAGGTTEAWELANRHFDVVFFILHQVETFKAIARNFRGAVLWRTYGLDQTLSYGKLLQALQITHLVGQLGRRFYFAEAYEHLADSEPDSLRSRRLFLPLGLGAHELSDSWRGSVRQIYFVCPEIETNPYYRKVYDDFQRNFDGMDYVVAGAQPIRVRDRRVLGYVSAEQHALNMTESRVMYYHSREPNHVHYHPFEAIRAGMPLVYMAGGLLDRLGGRDLPGRCVSVEGARQKIQSILADDRSLIDGIRDSQTRLLHAMNPDNCVRAWRDGFERIAADRAVLDGEQASRPQISSPRRIAVILPVGYRGGSLRGAFALAQALHIGSRQCLEDSVITLFHLDDDEAYSNALFLDLTKDVKRRPFVWRTLDSSQATRAMRFAGYTDWEPAADRYVVPDDGMRQLADCDIWLIVSDRLECPVLPLKPVVLQVFDYLQRYENVVPPHIDHVFLDVARSAHRILVTTEFARGDALQYAGVDPAKVSKLPMLVPEFCTDDEQGRRDGGRGFFLWPTNAAPHKNHESAALALQIYYEYLDGSLDCRVTGVNTDTILHSDAAHLRKMHRILRSSRTAYRRLKWCGELSDLRYQRLLAQARFLWHPTRIDNGTFAVVDAARLGVRSLSSDYPAMREINAQFDLDLAWMNADDPQDMAEMLKKMEADVEGGGTPRHDWSRLAMQSIEAHALAYWWEIRSCF